MINFTDGDW